MLDEFLAGYEGQSTEGLLALGCFGRIVPGGSAAIADGSHTLN